MAQQNEPMVELSTSRESLPVKLTHEEREERLSQAFAQIKRSGAARANEASLKFKAKEAKEEADSADMEAKRLMGIVEAGAEYRSVECVEVYDETTQTVRRVRIDTNIKRSGAARANEASLKFKAKEAKEEADSADMEAKRLMGIVEAGAEYRSVECVEVYDETTQTVRRVRIDTNEVLGTRQPNDLDKERIAIKRQRTLPGMGDAEKRNAGRGKKNSEEVTGTMH